MQRQATLLVARNGRAAQNYTLRILPNNVLTRMYAKCRNVAGLSDLVKIKCDKGNFKQTHFSGKDAKNLSVGDALALLLRVKSHGVTSDSGTLCKAFKACAALGSFEAGTLLYKCLVEVDLGLNVFVGSSLIDFYAKCGSIEDALKVFERTLCKNVVIWSAMISGLVQHKLNETAFELFSEMLSEGFKPNEVTYMSILRGCANIASLDGGRLVHDLLKQNRFEENVFVASTVVDMYAKCRSIADAHSVFQRMPSRNVVSYSALIAGYVQDGQVSEALGVFEQMREAKVKPDEVTFVSVLKGVASISALEEGRKIHALARKQGCETNKYVGSALVDMYAKCKSVKDAQAAFHHLAERDVVTWSSMIDAYAECGYANEALTCFRCMQIEGIKPVSFTFVGVLKAISSLADLLKGIFLHAFIIEIQEFDVFVGTALINMYVDSGSTVDAEQAFQKMPRGDVVLWNAMISGFVQHNLAAKALLLFRQMHIECVQPNAVTLVATLKACSSFMDIERVHVYIIALGLELELVLQNALTSMYAKCKDFEMARSLFNKLVHRNEISWNSIIAAYVQSENCIDVLSLFTRMVEECILPTEHAFTSIFKACCHGAVIWQGHKFHLLMLQSKCCYDTPLYNSLVDMYVKCGSLEGGRKVFDNMVIRSLLSWNIMIMGYAQHGMPKAALDLFHDMQDKDVKPNEVTLAGVLSACGHAGLINEGEFYYVTSDYPAIASTSEHLVCLAALLRRAGQMEKAEALIQCLNLEH